jgi:BirA family biotin operon repressor/biotin-[acetyl-CoA-carboxylase] ligase
VLNEEALTRALRAAGLSAPVRWDEVTDSTNTTALAMAAEGAPEWTLVAAGHQTAGRGRHGRTWVNRPGRALMCSVVLRPRWAPDRVGLLSLAAGAAMAEAASEVSGRDVRCKWPNDLILGESKVGGILGEAEIVGTEVRHAVVGVGVNLEVPDEVPWAGAIGGVDDEALLSAFLPRLRSLVEGVPGQTLERWRAVSATLGRRVEATAVGGDTARGVAADLDETGALLIDTGAGRVRVAFGEIRHLETLGRKDRGMFERFTADARTIIVRAQDVASHLGHDRIGPGHLLIAIAEGEANRATEALASARFQAARAREDLARIVEVAAARPGVPRRPTSRRRLSRVLLGRFGPATKKVLETSLRVSLRQGHNWIGAEHILLALLERSDPTVTSILSSQGVDPGAVRDEVVRGLEGGRYRV